MPSVKVTHLRLKTWPYRYLIDFKGYRFNEVLLKLFIWPFAVFFFGLSFSTLLAMILINAILRTWVVYPKALSNVSSQVFSSKSYSLFGWIGKLLSFVLLFFYGGLIVLEKFLRRFPLGILHFLDLKES